MRRAAENLLRSVAVALLLCGLEAVAAAQSVSDAVLSLRADAWSGDRQLSDRRGVASLSAWGRGRLDLGSAGQVVGNAWLRGQRPDDSEPDGRLRELYWRRSFGPVDVSVGRQMVVWGRADGLNPTDNLSPRDFRLLAPQDGDLRHGNESLKLETDFLRGRASLLWFPHAASHVIPLQALPGVRYVSEKPRASQWAVRWDYSGGDFDGSVSYFDGRDPLPDLTAGGASSSGLLVLLRNQRLRVLGADMSMTRGNAVWRAEAAATRTAGAGPGDLSRKKPQLWLVAGPEWSLGDSTTFGVQATWLHVEGYGDPDALVPAGPLQELAWRQLATSGQSGRNQGGFTWRLSRRLSNDSVTLETSGVALRSSQGGAASGLARAHADIALDDQWQLQTGGERYFGALHTQFGQLRANSLAFVQLRRGF